MEIIEQAKAIATLIKKYKDQDLYQSMVELREKILSLQEDNLSLKTEVAALKKRIEISEDLEREGNSYYRKSDTEKKHPFCLPCWDYEGKLISQVVHKMHGKTMVSCSICAARKNK